MSDVLDQLATAQAALEAAVNDLNTTSTVPTLADQVLAAVLPVLEAAGYKLETPADESAEAPLA